MQYDESEICNDLRSPSRAHASGCVRRQIGRLIAERVASPGEELNEEFCSTPSTPPRPRAALYFPSSVGGPLSETFPQPRSAQGEKISHDGPSSPSTQFEASFDFAGVKSGSCTVRSGRLQRSHSDDGNRSPLPTSWHEPYSMDRTTQARDAVSAAVEGEAIRHPATPCDPNASLSPQLDFEAPTLRGSPSAFAQDALDNPFCMAVPSLTAKQSDLQPLPTPSLHGGSSGPSSPLTRNPTSVHDLAALLAEHAASNKIPAA